MKDGDFVQSPKTKAKPENKETNEKTASKEDATGSNYDQTELEKLRDELAKLEATGLDKKDGYKLLRTELMQAKSGFKTSKVNF